jgi:hypothetical protein
MSQRAPMMSGRAKTHTSLTMLPINPLCVCGRIENMLIASFLFIAFVVAIGAIIVKTYEWHHDVLYGPYLNRID